jgi:hypothetical protein
MDDPFKYTMPFIQTFLANKGLTEYHISLHIDNTFIQAFYDNTQQSFFNTIYNYIAENYKVHIFYQGFDELALEEKKHTSYIYVHFKSEIAENIVKQIVDDLNKKYYCEWRKFCIPSLFSIVNENLKNSRYLANAISHFQQQNTFEDTQYIISLYYDNLAYNNKQK